LKIKSHKAIYYKNERHNRKNKTMIISVVIICYNQKDFIQQAIDSVLNQQMSYPYEIIIGDDGSTDGTSEIIAKYAKEHSEIRYYRHKKNLGLMRNYSFCHRQAKGKYIAVLDGDDYWIDKTKVDKQVAMLEVDNELGMVHTQYDIKYMYPKLLGKRNFKNVLSKNQAIENSSFDGIFANSAICSSTVCYRKKIVDDFKLMDEFDKGVFAMEDGPVFLVCSLNNSVGYIEQSSTVYRVNKNSVSHSVDIEKRLQFLKDTLAVREYFMKLIDVDHRVITRLNQNRCLSFAYHYYKSNDIDGFRGVYSQLVKKTNTVRLMYLFLLLKRFKLLKNDRTFKA